MLKKTIQENSNSANPDYDWNDKLKSNTDYDNNKTNNVYKKPNVSMALNNKSTNSPYEYNDNSGISPNKKDLDGSSIFKKEEEK